MRKTRTVSKIDWIKLDPQEWTNPSWTSPLNSRSCHVGWHQDKAAQGKHFSIAVSVGCRQNECVAGKCCVWLDRAPTCPTQRTALHSMLEALDTRLTKRRSKRFPQLVCLDWLKRWPTMILYSMNISSTDTPVFSHR